MSKKDIVKLVVFVVFLAVLSDVLWNVIRHTPATTVTATSVATAIPTSTVTTTPTQTVNPTATRTPYPTFIPTQAPTQVPGPGNDWRLVYEFSGGPEIYVRGDCYESSLNDCIDKEVEIYLGGHQFNKVFLNGFDDEHRNTWAARLVPGHNRLVVPEAGAIGIGNKTNVAVQEASSTGFYMSCSPDQYWGYDCTQYDGWIKVYQSPIGGGNFLTTIEFWSEYSNVFFLNDMVKEQSIAIESGTILILPKYDHETWDITVLPFYGERPTPMPSRTPQP